jgi:Fe-S-cluster containining protein
MSIHRLPLITVENLESTTFECTYGRGCPGLCCTNARPPVEPDEAARIERVLPRVLPELRAEALKLVASVGFVSRRRKMGRPMLRVVKGWCIFFNRGCVLQRLGIEEGDPGRYKPAQCSLFPLERADKGTWYLRQWGHRGEEWMLPCLNPRASTQPAAEGLAAEIALAERLTAGPSSRV